MVRISATSRHIRPAAKHQRVIACRSPRRPPSRPGTGLETRLRAGNIRGLRSAHSEHHVVVRPDVRGSGPLGSMVIGALVHATRKPMFSSTGTRSTAEAVVSWLHTFKRTPSPVSSLPAPKVDAEPAPLPTGCPLP